MIEVILCGREIFAGRFRMKAVARYGLTRWQVLREQISHAG